MQAGFTLLELLLSISLLALLLAGIYQIFNSWGQRAVNRTAASDMLRVQNAAEDYVLSHFESIRTAATNVFFEIDIEELKAENYLPTGYQPINAYRQRIRAFRRNLVVDRLNTDGSPSVDSAGNPARITTVEVVTVSDNPAAGTLRIANKRLLDAAQAGGPKMGIVSNLVMPGADFSNLVTSVYSEWSVNRADLFPAGYNAAPDANFGYLAAYGLVSAEAADINDRWLYRVTVDGRPELNRMATDLIMNGNRLENVNNVVADRIAVEGDAIFRGATNLASETAQAMTVEQALRVNNNGGSGESRINMKVVSGGCAFIPGGGNNRLLSGSGCGINGGEIQVVSATDNATLSVGTLTADGSIITDYTNANAANSAGITTFEEVDGTSMIASTTVLVPAINVTGTLVQTEQLQTANMNLTAGATVRDHVISSQIDSEAGSAGPARNVSTTTMDVGNAVDLTGNIVTGNLQATSRMYVNNASGSYLDVVLNRLVTCTPYAGNTYCEPNGDTWWGSDLERCQIHGSGYQCWYYRNGVYIGYCNFGRSSGTGGQAYHSRSCS